MNTHIWLSTIVSKLILTVVSLFQGQTLRERYYAQQERIVILETAIDDIARISASRAEQSDRHKLIIGIVDRIKNHE